VSTFVIQSKHVIFKVTIQYDVIHIDIDTLYRRPGIYIDWPITTRVGSSNQDRWRHTHAHGFDRIWRRDHKTQTHHVVSCYKRRLTPPYWLSSNHGSIMITSREQGPTSDSSSYVYGGLACSNAVHLAYTVHVPRWSARVQGLLFDPALSCAVLGPNNLHCVPKKSTFLFF